MPLLKRQSEPKPDTRPPPKEIGDMLMQCQMSLGGVPLNAGNVRAFYKKHSPSWAEHDDYIGEQIDLLLAFARDWQNLAREIPAANTTLALILNNQRM